MEDVFTGSRIFAFVGVARLVENVLRGGVDPLHVAHVGLIEDALSAFDGDRAILFGDELRIDCHAIEGDVDDLALVPCDDELAFHAAIGGDDDLIVFDDRVLASRRVARDGGAVGGGRISDGDVEDRAEGLDRGAVFHIDFDVEVEDATSGAEEFEFVAGHNAAENQGVIGFFSHGVGSFVFSALIDDECVFLNRVMGQIGHGAVGVDVDFLFARNGVGGIDVIDAVIEDFEDSGIVGPVGVPTSGFVLIDDEAGESALVLADEGLTDPILEFLLLGRGLLGDGLRRLIIRDHN